MIFRPVNIEEELIKEKNKQYDPIPGVLKLLKDEEIKDQTIIKHLHSGDGSIIHLDTPNEHTFNLAEIENICVKYRLRFLDSKYFKRDFPYEAILKVKEFEKKHNTSISAFKIIAPDKAFDLQEENIDPLLFVQTNKDEYYLLHKWGNDLEWYRKYLYFPIRNIYTYFVSVMLISALIAFGIPEKWYNVADDNVINMQMWFTMHCFIGLFFFMIFIGATSRTSFSSMVWNKRSFT